MSFPVIAGAVVLKVGKLFARRGPRRVADADRRRRVTSCLSGWFAVWGTLRLVRTRSFTPFVVYRVALGVLVLVVAGAGWR